MRVIIVANVEQQEEIALKNTSPGAELVFIQSPGEIRSSGQYDALFYLSGDLPGDDGNEFGEKAVFINSVIETLEQKKWPRNVSRINGWPGFLKRPTWEIASNNSPLAGKIFESLGWGAVFVKDEPGLVAARVISVIINEAFFGLEEEISSPDEIDLAMKLGTNYPYGPFEWQSMIGLQNIYLLLHSLSVKDKRYSVAPLMEKKYFELTSR